MTREKLTLFDTTLRDGAQMADVDFRSPTNAISRRCSTVSASITSRAAIRAPIRSIRNFSRKGPSSKAPASRPSA